MPPPTSSIESLSSPPTVEELLQAGKDTLRRMKEIVSEVREGILFQSGISDDALEGQVEESAQVWEQMKMERNAILALLLEDVWGKIEDVSRRSETGLVQRWADREKIVTPAMLAASQNALEDITSSMRNMCAWVLDDWQYELLERSEESDLPVDKAFRRMQKMNDFAHEHEIHFADVKYYHTNGISGALQIGHGIAEVIPKVYRNQFRKDISAEEYDHLMRGSYSRFFVRPAHLDKSVGVPLMNGPFRKNTTDRAVGFTMDPSALHIQDGALMLVREPRMPIAAQKSAQTQVGCPALFARSSDDTSVNRAFFEKYTNIVRDHHMSRYSS